jgi:hypothetical protein
MFVLDLVIAGYAYKKPTKGWPQVSPSYNNACSSVLSHLENLVFSQSFLNLVGTFNFMSSS